MDKEAVQRFKFLFKLVAGPTGDIKEGRILHKNGGPNAFGSGTDGTSSHVL
jgi:hypothetical protein